MTMIDALLAKAEAALSKKLAAVDALKTPEEREIKDMYRTLGLPAMYEKYEEESYKQIMALKESSDLSQVPWAVFDVFLSKIYKRSK